MRMVITKLQGGLGNQMFQYAVGRGISSKNKVFIDLEFLDANNHSSENFTARNFELGIFKNLNARRTPKTFNKLLFTKRYAFFRKALFPGFKLIQQKGFEFFETLANHKHVYLDGYFQNEKYFVSIRDKILKEFSFPPLDDFNHRQLAKINAVDNSVSVHIRRGDFIKPHVTKRHGILPESYYQKCIALVESKFNAPHYFIFSDDMPWCEKNFNFLKGRYTLMKSTDSQEAWKDMYLMTQCKHHIVANSSFSWWGAWLSERKGIKIAPKNWLNPEEADFNIRDFIPSEWIVVD